ncbi:hypothetical protein HYQ45_000800 [Verticillium longisporum]|uniref:Uncharacterized protein n=1 Tax=Verticillium longisporum TaxID=100787 RepID=A0A8I3A1H6_VERLO|nr:hypothetical protein HYQ45_000800 [Verticillium longisporum]
MSSLKQRCTVPISYHARRSNGGWISTHCCPLQLQRASSFDTCDSSRAKNSNKSPGGTREPTQSTATTATAGAASPPTPGPRQNS